MSDTPVERDSSRRFLHLLPGIVRAPALWVTVLTFAIVWVCAAVPIDTFIILVATPVLLVTQGVVALVVFSLTRRASVRQSSLILVALVWGGLLFARTNIFTFRSEMIAWCLGQEPPPTLIDLHFAGDVLTDVTTFAYFRCDPEELRAILTAPPFEGPDVRGPFSFRRTGFRDLARLPDLDEVWVFERHDIADGFCRVFTDTGFSFAYIEFAQD